MLNASVRSMAFGIVAALLLSGCSGTGNDVAPTTSTSMSPPKPEVVYQGGVDGCEAPVQTASIRERFIVKDGFDELIIDYGESGVGRATPLVRYPEEDKDVWGGEERTINTVADGTTCGSHGAHGPGDVVKVEPGEYEASLQYSGTVDIKFVITARSSRANMTDHAGHTT